jgi:hypothetical protein
MHGRSREHEEEIPSIYPQPAADRLAVALGHPAHEDMVVSAITMRGQTIGLPFAITGAQELAVDISKLPVGVYTLRVIDGNTVYSQTCMKLSP